MSSHCYPMHQVMTAGSQPELWQKEVCAWSMSMATRCCDMSCDCLSKYHGRASRDALRVWSGRASTVIHGPRYELDYGPRYALGRRATPRVGPPGRATRRAAGPRYASGRRAAGRTARRTKNSATAPLDLRTNVFRHNGAVGTHYGSGAAGLLR